MYYFAVVFISIAGILASVKWKNADPNFKPFLLILIYGFVSEIVSVAISRIYQNTSPPTNIYVLIAGILWIWQFHKWKTFGRFNRLPQIIGLSLILFWIWNLYYVGGIMNLLLHYRIYISFLLVILSVHQLNYYIVHYKGNLFKSSLFLICTGLLIQNTLKILTECFYMTNTSGAQKTYIVGMMICLLLFIVAMYYLPRKNPRLSRS